MVFFVGVLHVTTHVHLLLVRLSKNFLKDTSVSGVSVSVFEKSALFQ